MQEFKKVIALYEYTKKLVELKYSVVSDINKQLFSLPVKAIPEYEQYTSVSFRDFVETDDDMAVDVEPSPLLRVQKPDFQSCPKPAKFILQWLEDGWDNYKNSGEHLSEREIEEEFSADANRVATYQSWTNERNQWIVGARSNNDLHPCPVLDAMLNKWVKGDWNNPLVKIDVFASRPVVVNFTDSKERVTAYEKWMTERKEWVERQRKISAVRDLFMRLFNVYTNLNRESETQELMIGSGVLRTADNSQINHPVLLKRVSIRLDAKENIITIFDSENAPEIYTLLLSSVADLNHSVIKSAQEELAQGFFHPLDRNNASDFVKAFAHRLSSDSDFAEYGAESKKIATGIQVSMDEHVFFVRKKIDGTLKALETIIETINTTHEYPLPLGELVSGGMIEIPEAVGEPTIEERLAYANGENPDILLSKAANREQLEIAERIERYNAVLVQGPPGTGKTHTIANLIGHFLAQGKSVLVTSYTAKALSVVQEKLPRAIRSLCVTVASDDNSGMVRSIDDISEFMARHTANEIKQRAESAQAKRESILKQLNNIRKKLYQIRYSEFKPIVFGGDEYSPKEAAEFVRQHSDDLSYIPGKVELYRTLPVTLDDLIFVYKYNGTVSQSEEMELAVSLPNPATLPSVLDFQNLCDDFNVARSETVKPAIVPEITGTPDFSKVDYIIDTYVNPLKGIDSWAAFVAADGKRGGGYRQMWEKLCSFIIKASEYSTQNIELLLGKKIQIDDSVTIATIRDNSEKLIALYANGKPSRLNLMFRKEIKTIVSGVIIDGQFLATSRDCHTLAAFVELEYLRAEIAPLWNELLAKKGVPDFRSLGDEPESIAARFVEYIKVYLDWSKTYLEPFKSDIEGTGLSFDAVFHFDRMATEQEQFVLLFNSILHKLPSLLQSVSDWTEYNNCVKSKEKLLSESIAKQTHTQNCLNDVALNNSTVCRLLRQAVTSLDVLLYSEQYGLLCKLYEKYDAINRRREILDRIKPVAPFWAESIEERRGIHGNSVCPDSIADAWKWKQFAGIIDDLTGQPFEALQRENAILATKFRETTADLAADKAWYHILRTTEADLSMRQALQGWKMTVRRIGKGTGKNAPMYRRQAMEQMSMCQRAVPAWIMPINKAMDTLNPAINKFDVVIVDEASQCDLSSIGILYMAKKIIIVGDDKQVSPLSIGMNTDRINALRDMYIKDIIPNWHLYESKTSLYDIAQTTFQPLMLREHFRCLPEIIGYSNKLSYDYKIKPLREAGTARLLPAVVNYRVADGMRDGRRKRNEKEAASIVAIIRACIEQPEYDGMTFGVISLLGDEQAVLIQTQILEQIPAQIIEERRILCGNASHFQGDERDIILLSLVDSNEGDGPLRLTGDGADASTKQRYNVAASRAKEQLWVVHSLDYTKDLKNGDMRRDLIEYANDPNAFLQVADAVEKRSESPFEEAVGRSIVSAGYRLEQQYPVGAYRLDMVISCGNNKVALECDGEAWHSSELQIRSDMERQAILERIGWRFVRVRGSEYYRNPEKTMARVMNDLAELGIVPERKVDERTASDLLERVKIRVNQIMDDANGIDVSENGETTYAEEKEVDVLPIAKRESEDIVVPIQLFGAEIAELVT
jgi:very-short-patch-repair endonuclease/cellulose biosynthesis protein BcsQ